MGGDLGEQSVNIKNSEEFIMGCVAEAALKTNGVAALGKTLGEAISTNWLGRTPLYNGIRLSRSENEYTVDVFVIVDFGVNIPAVAWDLQENIKKNTEKRISEKISAINIYVQDVKFPD